MAGNLTESSDHSELQSLFADLKALYGPMRTELEADAALIQTDFGDSFIPNKWLDDGLAPTLLPTAYNAVENAADHILHTPHIFVPPRDQIKNREEAQMQAEKIRRFANLWWHRVFEDQGDPLRRAKKHLIKGRLCLKKTIDWSLLPEAPAEDATRSEIRKWKRQVEKIGRSQFIWTLDLLSPFSVFEDPEAPWDPAYVFEERQITAIKAKMLWPTASTFDSGVTPPVTQTLTVLEYYSKPRGEDQGQHIVWLEDEIVEDDVNPYSWKTPADKWDGYVPYFIADPGWGWEDIEEGLKPEDRYVSLIRPLRSLIVAESRQLTAVESWLRMYVWPLLKATNLREDPEKPLELGPGSVLFMDDGQDLAPMAFGEAPVTAFQFLSKVQVDADRTTKFGALGGTAQAGVSTATESDANIRNAATKLSGPVDGLRRLVARITRTNLQDIELVFEGAVTLYGAPGPHESEAELGPRDLKGHHHVFVELQTSDQAALDARNARLWGDLFVRMPNLSQRTAMEKAGIDNPSEEFDQRELEDLLRSPEARQVRLIQMLQAMGEEGQRIAQTIQQNTTAGGVPVEGAPPATPGGGDALGAPGGASTPEAQIISAGSANALAQLDAANR